jgi:hypothetical protein
MEILVSLPNSQETATLSHNEWEEPSVHSLRDTTKFNFMAQFNYSKGRMCIF